MRSAAFGHAAQARPLGVGRRGCRPHERQRDQGDRKREHVHPVGGGKAGSGNQDPGERRAGDGSDCAAQDRQGAGRGHLVLRRQPRQHRVQRRPLQGVQPPLDGGEAVDDPQLRVLKQRVGQEQRRADHEDELGEQDHEAAVARVGEGAAQQCKGEDRPKQD